MAAAVDTFAGRLPDGNFPAGSAAAAAQSDTVDLPYVTRGIAIGAAGILKVNMLDGTTVTIPSGTLAAGVIHPLRISRIFSSVTTATGIWVFW
jgi:hypothetical protein